MSRLPQDTTHVFVSIGGNDALSHLDLLNTAVRSTAEALELFARRVGQFESDYRDAVLPLARLERPVTLCTIYNGWFPDVRERTHARTALALFNDVVLRTAIEARFGIIELRHTASRPRITRTPSSPRGRAGARLRKPFCGRAVRGACLCHQEHEAHQEHKDRARRKALLYFLVSKKKESCLVSFLRVLSALRPRRDFKAVTYAPALIPLGWLPLRPSW